MLLYHFPPSPFARRVRLALSHKRLHAELRDARNEPKFAAELRELNPFHTVPTLVDGDRVVIDSHAILQYLDRKVPDPPLWPAGLDGAEAHELIAMCDGIVTHILDLGARYHALHDHPRFGEVRAHFVGRSQRGLEALAKRVASRAPGAPLCGDTWSAADMAVYTMSHWFETMPSRVAVFAPTKNMLELGCKLPAEISRWAEPLRQRDDVRALD